MPIDSPAIRWLDDHLLLLDQRHLPSRTEWLAIHDAAGAAGAIRDMAVRGAPAIGITAAYGLALEALGLGRRASLETLRPALETLAASRPTAVNLFWALERLQRLGADLEGEALGPLRVLRGAKNRFGSTNEIGVFEMRDTGLAEVLNPSALFLDGRQDASEGSAVFAGLEGSRPVLTEIQALVAPAAFADFRNFARASL